MNTYQFQHQNYSFGYGQNNRRNSNYPYSCRRTYPFGGNFGFGNQGYNRMAKSQAVPDHEEKKCGNIYRYRIDEDCGKKRKICEFQESGLHRVYLKQQCFGGFMLPGSVIEGEEFVLAALSLPFDRNRNGLIQLDFACNLMMYGTEADLSVQIYKIWDHQPFFVPVASPIVYVKNNASQASDCLFVNVCDCGPLPCGICTYFVKLRMRAKLRAGGRISVLNPILTAVVQLDD